MPRSPLHAIPHTALAHSIHSSSSILLSLFLFLFLFSGIPFFAFTANHYYRTIKSEYRHAHAVPYSRKMATSPAGRMLSRQLQHMQSDKDIPGISCGLVDSNVFEWEVMLMISDDVQLYGGELLFIALPTSVYILLADWSTRIASEKTQKR